MVVTMSHHPTAWLHSPHCEQDNILRAVLLRVRRLQGCSKIPALRYGVNANVILHILYFNFGQCFYIV